MTTSDEKDLLATPQETGNALAPEAAIDTPSTSEATEATEATEAIETTEATAKPNAPKTCDEVLAALRQLVADEVVAERSLIDFLKFTYYRLREEAAKEALNAHLAEGNAFESFMPAVDNDEAELKDLLKALRHRRTRMHEEQELQKQANLARKQAIIERFRAIGTSSDTVDANFKEFKELQAEWLTIKQVPAEQVSTLWNEYKFHVELIYDLMRQNHEMRELDFKRNLEAKVALCEEAEALTTATDVIGAFNQLQQLHDRYRETGPVARTEREEIWKRFKAASTTINRRHTQHFEQLKQEQEENYTKKLDLCTRLEALIADAGNNNTRAQWDKMSEAVIALQAEWKGIGFAPKKVNDEVYQRFRTACDAFFTQKNSFIKALRQDLNENLRRKTSLAEAAEALQDSTDWAATTNKIVELQKEWKAIGAVPHRHSEAVWQRFHTACNTFFERKQVENAGQNNEEKANLQQKRNIIGQIEALLEERTDAAETSIRELMAQWREVGRVPYRNKEKINGIYKKLLDRVHEFFYETQSRRGMDNFRKQLDEKGGNDLDRQRHTLVRAYEAKKAEIANFETNLHFLTSKSKQGNSLVAEMQRNVEKQRQELEQIAQKIAAVDAARKAAQA